MKSTYLKRIFAGIILLSLILPSVPSYALTITLHVPDAITIGKPFRVYTNKLPDGFKIKIMFSGHFPRPESGKLTWTLNVGSDGKVDEELKFPIGSYFDYSNLRVSFRYYDPDKKEWFYSTSDAWVDLVYPVKSSYVLEIMQGYSGLENNTIVNHLSELYYLEELVSDCNIWWKMLHKVMR